MLGIPVIPDSTGVAQHRAVVDLLEDWGILNNVIGLCFDTTASNTGRLKGSAAIIKSTVDHSVLWLACRHHVYELDMKHVSVSIIGKRNSPSEALFVRFKKVSKNSFDNFDDVFKFVERLTNENSIRLRITDLLKSMMSL